LKVTIRIVKPQTDEEKRRVKKGEEVIDRIIKRMLSENSN